MDKKYVKTIIAVVLGIGLVTMAYTFFSLLIEAVLMDDIIIKAGSSVHDILVLAQDMVIALICVTAVTFVCYAFAFFGNGKIFNIFSAVLSLLIVVMCLAFIFVLNKTAFEAGSSSYEAVMGYLAELIQLAAPSIIACVYFTVCSCLSFKKQQPESMEVGSEQD